MSPARDALAAEIARRVVAFGGAALIVDYGHAETAPGDTLQAMRGHAFADPLAAPGEADLTAHVDFAALARRARAEGAAVHGPITQGEFLLALGLLERAGRLGAGQERGGAGGAPRGRGTPRRAGADGHALQGAGDHAAGRRPATRFRNCNRHVTEQEPFSGVSRPLSNGQNRIGEIMRRFPR